MGAPNLLGALYRARSVALVLSTLGLLGGVVVRLALPAGGAADVAGVVALVSAIGYAAAIALAWFGGRRIAAREREAAPLWVAAPVGGRWLALNSPATQVPSHGVRGYGQSHAVDLVYAPHGAVRPEYGSGPAMRPASDFPALGEPVHAMIDGVVVRATGWRRDHRSRSSSAAMIYLMIEGMLRELGGPGFVIGNHVVIRGEGGLDGVYAAVAHLRRGSLRVKPGDRVTAGQVVGECGNSGNSSEPHVHAQLMDRRSFVTAQGIAMAFTGLTIEQPNAAPSGGSNDDSNQVEPTVPGMPRSGEFLTA
ncbi:peptidase M23-like protein [Leucobacter komagatae]|uniref:Peptidase M23-like protein n=1 Tax=Leucobacter komagatae TaxID=55969 RepID=A0A542Y2T1_9MICO|nr:M23 family metallopeptidase [Leucobacter komagatae]TQL42386.1 peptidase M23-like protein [Leucobacter komagatae]